MELKELLKQKGRIFLVPIDHPMGSDTEKLEAIGKQNFINMVDTLNHDGYIFHSHDYIKSPFKTTKDFFLTIGELPEDYKFDIQELEKFPHIKHVTIFFDIDDANDEKPYEFYKDYVFELKNMGYFVMAMGFPKEKTQANLDVYSHIVDIAFRLGCDAIKTDFFEGIEELDTKGMYLVIGGGACLENEEEFNNFVDKVGKLKTASYSFGRNIFESDNYEARISRIAKIINI